MKPKYNMNTTAINKQSKKKVELKWLQLWFTFNQPFTFNVKELISVIDVILAESVFHRWQAYMENTDCPNLGLQYDILYLPFTILPVLRLLCCLCMYLLRHAVQMQSLLICSLCGWFILPRLWYPLLSCGLKQVWSYVVNHYRVYLHYISGTVWCVVYGTCAQRWSYRKFHLYFWLYWETVNESKNWASCVCWLTRHSEHHCYQGYQFGQLRSKNFWVHFSCCVANRSNNRWTEEVTTIQPTERE